MGTSVQSFTVDLSANVDKKSVETFNKALSGLKADVLKLTAAFSGIAAGALMVSDHFSRLAFEARNAGSTVDGLGKLSYAMKQMGGSSEDAKASVTRLFDFLHYRGPGAELAILRLGVATRDVKGHFRDTADILTDLGYKFRAMVQQGRGATAFQWAQYLGIGESTFKALTANPLMFKQFEGQYEDIYKRLGLDPNKAGQQSVELMRQVRRLGLALEVMSQKIALSLVHAFGGKNLNDFTNYLMAHSDEISQSIDDMAKVILMATNGLVEICKELNTAVEKTVGWKIAFEGLLGLFALSKLSPLFRVIGGLGKILGWGASATGAVLRFAGGLVPGFAKTALKVGAAGVGLGVITGVLSPNKSLASTDTVGIQRLMQARAQESMDFFTSKGFNKYAAAGLTGNLMQESKMGFNTTGGGGIGIAQWTPERAAQIKKDFGIDVRNSDFHTQLVAMYDEMTKGDDAGARTAYRLLQNTKDAAISAMIAKKYYERPKDAKGDEDLKRSSLAVQALSSYNAVHFNNQPVQTNHITVNVQGQADAQHIATTVASKLNSINKGYNNFPTPRNVGITGHS